MKAQVNFNLYLDTAGGKVIGSYTQSMGHGTYLWINGDGQVDDGEGNLSQDYPMRGDEVTLLIPSGTFSGVVISAETDPYDNSFLFVQAKGEWRGKWAGLRGRASCYGKFEAFPPDSDATVTTSAWHEPVPFRVYGHAHAATSGIFFGQPVRKREALAEAIALLMKFWDEGAFE